MQHNRSATDQRIDDLTHEIDSALAALQRREAVSLEGLAGRIEVLCSDMLQLPVGAASSYRLALEALVTRLDKVREAMDAREKAIGATGPDQAAQAYRKSDGYLSIVKAAEDN